MSSASSDLCFMDLSAWLLQEYTVWFFFLFLRFFYYSVLLYFWFDVFFTELFVYQGMW